jgi:hypothetical protein
MNDIEQRLSDFLEADGSRAEIHQRLDDITSSTPQLRMAPINERRSWVLPSLAAASVAALTIGGLGVIMSRDASQPPATSTDSPAPLPPSLPVTGVAWTLEAEIKVNIAKSTLIQECMADAGWSYDLADPSVYVEEMGTYIPHPVLGIGNVEAATAMGYHHEQGGVLAIENFARTLSPDDEAAFFAALNGTSDGVTSPQGCFIAASVPLEGLDQDEPTRVVVNETGIDQERVAAATQNDPRIQEALDQWRTCVTNDVGETADTPNDLAQRFAFDQGPNSREIEVATADARCQNSTELVSTWSGVYAEYQREALGDDAFLFDQLALSRIQIIEQAEEILSTRSITIPSD